jgi:hypothetical protein
MPSIHIEQEGKFAANTAGPKVHRNEQDPIKEKVGFTIVLGSINISLVECQYYLT